MDDVRIRRAVAVNWWNLALGHDVRQVDHATLVTNAALPIIYDANFVFDVSASKPAEIDRLLAHVGQAFSHAAHLTFRVDPFTPPSFEARLVMEGYSRSDSLVLLLEGDVGGEAGACELTVANTDAAWDDYARLKGLDWRESASKIGQDPDNLVIAEGLTTSNRAKSPPVEYVLAYQDGRAVGFCSAWTGLEGMGQVEDLFVTPAYRHRGIATALLTRCVAMLRARGIGSVVLVADPTGTTREMYAKLGWTPLAVCRQYGKPAL